MAYVGVKEVAEHFSVSEETVRRWTRKKIIPYKKVGRTVRYSLEEIDKAITIKEDE